MTHDLQQPPERGTNEPSRDRRWWRLGAGQRGRPVLITGGAGFIGTNLAHRLLSSGRPVLVFDNLSRPGVEQNLAWLVATHRDLVEVEVADVLDVQAVERAVERSSAVFHFAAQVAVTTSLVEPLHDFETNARGTLNVLEAVRAHGDRLPLVYTSTNKVYGALEDVDLVERERRYEPSDPAVRERGIGEDRRLDFHSPYGCSKGAADQYVLDYARTFSIPAVVFRMSCIYGPHQFGTEDQGWVAHFLIRGLERELVTIHGSGRQVRDVLYVDDLVDALSHAEVYVERLAGRVFNIGGGPANTISLLELLDAMGRLPGASAALPGVRFADWRSGDQRYYVSDIERFHTATGWRPRVPVAEGVARLHHWLAGARRPSAGVRSRAEGVT